MLLRQEQVLLQETTEIHKPGGCQKQGGRSGAGAGGAGSSEEVVCSAGGADRNA